MRLEDAQREAGQWQEAAGDPIRRYWELIEEQERAGKKILLVEGDDDRDVLERCLNSLDPLWQRRLYVAAAGGRPRVLQKLGARPAWYAVVDRDTWEDGDINEEVARYEDRLHVTAGWCLENLFLADQAALTRAIRQVAALAAIDLTPLYQLIHPWADYGTVWWILHREQERMRKQNRTYHPDGSQHYYGYPKADPPQPVDEAGLNRYLNSLPNPTTATEAKKLVAKILKERDALPHDMPARILKAVPGKEFFRSELVPWLSQQGCQHDAAQWRQHIAQNWPADRWPRELQIFLRSVLN